MARFLDIIFGLFGAAGAALVLTAFLIAGARADVTPATQAIDASVTILDGIGHICSGAVINKKSHLVVTAGHCVIGAADSNRVAGKYAKVLVDGHVAYIFKLDRAHDVALVIVPDKSWSPAAELPLSEIGPQPGDLLFEAGHPLGNPGTLIGAGLVAGFGEETWGDEGITFSVLDAIVMTSMGICKGNSGAALVNRFSQVVGIVVAGGPNDCGPFVYAVPARYVHAMLEGGHAQ